MKKFNNHSFDEFLSKHNVSELINNDFVDQQNFNRKEIKAIIKKFWKSKESFFYQEAYFWKWSINVVTIFWYLLFTIGFTLISLANSGIAKYTQHFAVFVSVGIILVLIGIVINWVYIYFIIKHKPSFYQIVLQEAQIKSNIKAICFFLGIGVGTIIAKALMSAILKEMILLAELEQTNKI